MAKSFNKSRYFFDCPPDCPKRKPACHDHCKIYQEKRAELDEINRQRKLKYEATAYVSESVIKKRDRMARTRRDYPKSKFHY